MGKLALGAAGEPTTRYGDFALFRSTRRGNDTQYPLHPALLNLLFLRIAVLVKSLCNP